MGRINLTVVMHPWVASSVFIANWLKGKPVRQHPNLDGLFDLGVILKGTEPLELVAGSRAMANIHCNNPLKGPTSTF